MYNTIVFGNNRMTIEKPKNELDRLFMKDSLETTKTDEENGDDRSSQTN